MQIVCVRIGRLERIISLAFLSFTYGDWLGRSGLEYYALLWLSAMHLYLYAFLPCAL